MPQLFLNNFQTQFIASVKAAPESSSPALELDYGVLRVSDGAAGLLLNPGAGNWYVLTAFKRSGSVESDYEVLRVIAVDNAVIGECRLTVLRGQEGTTPRSFIAGDVVELRLTAGGMGQYVQTTDARLSNPRAPTGAAGGVLSGTFPNPGFAQAMATVADLGGKVDKVSGKGLSANDYTNADLAKLSGVAEQSTKNSTDAQLRDRASHTGAQAIGTVTGLQAALDAKAPSASPALTGTPTTPTAAAGTNTTQIASTAHVTAKIAASAAPIAHVGSGGAAHANATTAVDGFMSAADKTKLDGVTAGAQPNAVTSVSGRTGAVVLAKTDVGLGSVDNTADAAKPVSTSQQAALDQKANLASPAFTGVPTAPTAAATANTTQVATMAAVQAVNSSDTGSAATALTLKTARTIALSGGATGTATSFDGGGNISIPVTGLNMGNATAGTLAVARGGTGTTTSTGTGANVQAVSPALTGTPTVPTAAAATNNTQAASTAFVQAALASKQATLVSGSNVKTVNGESILGPGDIAIAGGGAAKGFYFHTADNTLIVPAGVTTLRFYAGGSGGTGGGYGGSGAASGGGGGGFAFGDLAVVQGDSVAISFSAGIATVKLNGVTVGLANPGLTGSGGAGNSNRAGGAGGTASITAAVTNGGAYSGGVGGAANGPVSGVAYNSGGGGSCGSPLGDGFPGGSAASYSGAAQGGGGGGIGGAGANVSSLLTNGGGGGAGEAGAATYGGGTAARQLGRGITDAFADPLLRMATGPRASAGSLPLSGAGGFGSDGADFGGGAALVSGAAGSSGYIGGLMGGGGGNATGNGRIGGAGGYGGGGGGGNSGGIGGAPFCFLYY